MDAWGTCEIDIIASLPMSKDFPLQVLTIGEHIRAHRIKNKQSQEEVAKQINVTTDSITGWELNRFSPQIQFMPSIIKYLGYLPVPIDTQSFAGKVHALRITLGVSQRKLGKVLNIDPSTIEGWETNKHRPSPKMIKKIDQLFKNTF